MMDFRYSQRNRLFYAILGLLVCCCAMARVYAEIAIEDDWDAAGTMVVGGDHWEFSVKREDAALALSSGGQIVRVCPFGADGVVATEIAACEVTDLVPEDHAGLRVAFRAGGETLEAQVDCWSHGTMRITPGDGVAGAYVRAPISVGLLPGVRLEDVLYYPKDFPNQEEIHVPSENWFAGLMHGEGGIVACAWPEGNQDVRLLLSGEGADRCADAMAFSMDGRALYLEVLAAPAIWHLEPLELSYLEKAIKTGWKRPINATYKTQLPLKGITTTIRSFPFQDGRIDPWRPEIGSYTWPVWFDNDEAVLFLSKRIPPKGDAVFYPVSGNENTLTDFVHRTPIGALVSERADGHGLPPGPDGAPNVGFNACWGTYLLRRTIYTLGAQDRDKEYFSEHADFLADYVGRVQLRNAGYFAFIEQMRGQLDAWLADSTVAPPVRGYLNDMVKCLDGVEEGHKGRMELFGDTAPEAHMAHARYNAKRLKELLDTPGPEIYPECQELIDQLNRMAWGHNEATGMRFSMLVRDWAQQAALGCADNAAALEYGRQIRAAIRNAMNKAAEW